MTSSIERLVTTTSTTPRTARRYVEELERLSGTSAEDAAAMEMIYTEAKVALHNGDTLRANTLLNQCPGNYRNVSVYKKKIGMYDTMCTKGIIGRRNSEDIRQVLCTILHCEPEDTSVRQYSDCLLRHGYSKESIEALTMGNMDVAMTACSMSIGHRCLFERYVQERTPMSERILMSLVSATERCGTIAMCLRGVAFPEKRWKREDETFGD